MREGADETVDPDPGPGGRDAKKSASGAVDESGWDVQQAEAQCLGSAVVSGPVNASSRALLGMGQWCQWDAPVVSAAGA